MISVQPQIMQATEPAARIFGTSTEELMRSYAEYIIFGIDVVTGIVIVITAAMAIVGFFRVITRTAHPHHRTIDKETIRLRLARGMLLAINLQVGSVILKAIIVPSFSELAMLAAIVGIKIVLGWTLSKEVNRHHDQGLRWHERGRTRDQPQQQQPFGQQDPSSKKE
jgi:uncharacterized membrane protein